MHEASLMGPDAADRTRSPPRRRPGGSIGVTVWLGALSHMSPDHFAEHFERPPPARSPRARGSTSRPRTTSATPTPRTSCWKASRWRPEPPMTTAARPRPHPGRAPGAAARSRCAARSRAWASALSSTARRPRSASPAGSANTADGVTHRGGRATPSALAALVDAIRAGAAAHAVVDAVETAAARRPRRGRLRDPPERPFRRAHGAGAARPGDLRRLPRRAVRPRRPALPLSLHQLHPVRPALQHHRGPALRPRAHLDARASPCARPARPSTTTRRPPLPRRTQRLSRLRPAPGTVGRRGAVLARDGTPRLPGGRRAPRGAGSSR